MEAVNISEFRSNLLNCLKKVQDGHEIIITTHGKTLAAIVPPHQQKQAINNADNNSDLLIYDI